MVNGVLASGDGPWEFFLLDRCFEVHAIVDSSFDLGAFLVIVPGGNDQCRELMVSGVEASGLGEWGEPGLAALLIDAAAFAPTGVGVVEAFVGRAHSNFVGVLGLGIKTFEILQAHGVGGGGGFGSYPGIGAVGVRIAECGGVAKEE